MHDDIADPSSINWGEAWKARQQHRRAADDPAIWDQRARHFRPHATHPYSTAFLEHAGVLPGETVLDMGCGAGSLAIPLAHNGALVLACDFSHAMLDTLRECAEEASLSQQISCRHLAWEDDWEACGIARKSVDVAIASRSIATTDLQAALFKLDQTARRRCCTTLVVGPSPRYDARVMEGIGIDVTPSNDFIYAFNMLIELGRLPEVSYIVSPRLDTFDSLDEAVADYSRMLDDAHAHKLPELRSYLADHLLDNPHAGEPGGKGKPQGALRLDHERTVTWAFISWNPAGA